jgi:hypothetical protein
MRPFRARLVHARPSRRSLLLLAALATTSALPACGAASGAPSNTGAEVSRKLPAYSGDVADQFDDVIEPHAVGLELENFADPKNDLQLRARAQSADVALRARVTTVTGESSAGSRAYQITFASVERLAGKHPVGDSFTVHVDKSSPSLGIVKSMEGQLVGKVLVIFLKAFARPDGDRDLHFHASADGADTAAAVREAVILDEVK